jgi:hypothetical protein
VIKAGLRHERRNFQVKLTLPDFNPFSTSAAGSMKAASGLLICISADLITSGIEPKTWLTGSPTVPVADGIAAAVGVGAAAGALAAGGLGAWAGAAAGAGAGPGLGVPGRAFANKSKSPCFNWIGPAAGAGEAGALAKGAAAGAAGAPAGGR